MKTLTKTIKIFLFLVFCYFSTTILYAQKSKNTDDAVISSQIVPIDMDKEHIYTLTYTVKNTGTTTWNAADYKLKVYVSASSDIAENSRWLVPNVSISNNVLPGMETTVTTQVTAWNDNGNYSFTAQMGHNDAPFGKASDPVVVNVH